MKGNTKPKTSKESNQLETVNQKDIQEILEKLSILEERTQRIEENQRTSDSKLEQVETTQQEIIKHLQNIKNQLTAFQQFQKSESSKHKEVNRILQRILQHVTFIRRVTLVTKQMAKKTLSLIRESRNDQQQMRKLILAMQTPFTIVFLLDVAKDILKGALSNITEPITTNLQTFFKPVIDPIELGLKQLLPFILSEQSSMALLDALINFLPPAIVVYCLIINDTTRPRL